MIFFFRFWSGVSLDAMRMFSGRLFPSHHARSPRFSSISLLTKCQKTTRADMTKDRKAFEHKINMDSDAVNTEVELRTRELLRLRDEKQQEHELVETRQVARACGARLTFSCFL